MALSPNYSAQDGIARSEQNDRELRDGGHDGAFRAGRDGGKLNALLLVGGVVLAAAVAAGVARRRRNRSFDMRRFADFAPDLRALDVDRAIKALSYQADRLSDRLADVAPSRREASHWGRRIMENSEREWDQLAAAAAPALERFAVKASDFVRGALKRP